MWLKGEGLFSHNKLFGTGRTAASLLLVFKLFKNHKMQGTQNPEK
jgi:hypothetical protein